MVTIIAPAKINLTLEVLGKRPDGFHEIRSVVQTINLCDSLLFEVAEKLDIKSNSLDWIAEKSLVSKVAKLIQKHSGRSAGAVIAVEKHIPLVSGLGGDSSDAAAALLGLNLIWQSGFSHNKLVELASQLGSDITFFLHGGTALLGGRGEIVTPLPPLSRWWVVLVLPTTYYLPVKTKLLYERLNASHFTSGKITGALAERLTERKKFSPAFIYNVFEQIAFDVFPDLTALRERMLRADAPNVHLAGTGPTLFALFDNKYRANVFYRRFKAQNVEVYLAETFDSNTVV